MLSARELSIAWSTNPLYWCWKPLLHSRFPEGVELIMVCWLEIKGKINTRMLSPRTTYGAYLIVNLAGRAFGLDSLPSEISVKVGGDHESKGIVLIRRNYTNSRKQELERVLMRHRAETLRSRVDNRGGTERALCDRGDGWLEIELGEFYSDGVNDKEVTMCLREVKGEHLKGGLIVEGRRLKSLIRKRETKCYETEQRPPCCSIITQATGSFRFLYKSLILELRYIKFPIVRAEAALLLNIHAGNGKF